MLDRRRFCAALATAGLPRPPRAAPPDAAAHRMPILVYHRFAPQVRDSMTIRVDRFRAHLDLLHEMDCEVVPLADWVAYCRGERGPLPPRAVVLSADDGHRSQYEVMAPLLEQRRWQATLFVYPSAISNADYAMSWTQLQELSAAGFAVQSHTYWHPNLLQERRRQEPEAFRRFVGQQLERSRALLEDKLARSVSLLAWPFGLSDEGLRAQAAQSGWRAAFGLGNRAARASDDLYDQPRWLVTDAMGARQLRSLLAEAFDLRGAA